MGPTLLLLRHGQIRANREGRWHGSTDSPLTLRGRWQAWLTGRFLAGRCELAKTYTSPLQRCRHTAALAAGEPEQHTVVSKLAEMSIGDWEGITFDTLREDYQLIDRLNDDLTWAPPQGESLLGVADRMSESLEWISKQHAPEETVLVVSHGAAMALALAKLLHDDPGSWQSYHFDNCSLTKIRLGEPNTLIDFNNSSHRRPFS